MDDIIPSEYDPIPVDPCTDGHAHDWKEHDEFVRRGVLYHVLRCKKCRELSIGWQYHDKLTI